MKPLSKQAARDIIARVVDKNPNLTKAQVFRHGKRLVFQDRRKTKDK